MDVVGRHRGLVLRTVLISSLTLSSRLVGFAREALAASMFGDRSPVNDAFVTAWRVPNLFRSLLGEGAMSTSMQTAITKADAEGGEDAGRSLFLALVRVVGGILLALCVAVMLAVHFMPDRMPVFGLSWLGAHPGPVRELTVRMMPFVVLVCLSAVCSGALNVRGHFLSTSLAPFVLNVTWIGSLALVGARFGWSRGPGVDDAAEYARQLDMARWLAALVLIGGAVMLAVQVPALVSRGFLGKGSAAGAGAPTVRPTREAFHVIAATAPLALGAAVYQVNVMVDGFMALSLLPEGGATVLSCATRLQQFPMSLVSIAATSAVFPALTALGHGRAYAGVRSLHDRTQQAVAFVAIPASVGLLVFAEPVVSVCFQHGAFGPDGVARASAGLRCLTLAIVPAGAAGLIARTYYALGDFKTPVKISVAMLLSNIALNTLFVRGFGMDVEGLALATAATAWGNMILLAPGLRRRLGLPGSEPGFLARILKMAVAATASTLAAKLLYTALLGTKEVSASALLASIGAAVGLYALLSQLLRVPEWSHIVGRVRARFRAQR